jgi:hypothetical protein
MTDRAPLDPVHRPTPDGARRGTPDDGEAPSHVPPQPLSRQARHALAELRRDGIDAAFIAERFPHVLYRVGERWDAPIDVLEQIGELLVDRRGGRRGFPDEALSLILALQRHTVRRIVVAAGLPGRPATGGFGPGTRTPLSPS